MRPRAVPAPGMLAALAQRLKANLPLKLTMAACCFPLCSLLYVTVEHWHLFPATVLPTLWLDNVIPFHTAAAWPYLTFFVYLALTGSLQVGREEILRFCIYIGALSLLAATIFLVYPTAVPVRPVATAQPYAMILATDDVRNACPSLHIALTVFAAIAAHRALRQLDRGVTLRVINWTWAVTIMLSTMVTRQHLALDVAGGLAIGLPAGLLWSRGTRITSCP